MNQAGRDYITEVNKRYKANKAKFFGFDIVVDESMLMERLMRLGVESRVYELVGDSEHRQMALATLRDRK